MTTHVVLVNLASKPSTEILKQLVEHLYLTLASRYGHPALPEKGLADGFRRIPGRTLSLPFVMSKGYGVNVLTPYLQTTGFTLRAANKSQRKMARSTKVNRKTVCGLGHRFTGQANSPGVTTGSDVHIPPPRPPAPKRLFTLGAWPSAALPTIPEEMTA